MRTVSVFLSLFVLWTKLDLPHGSSIPEKEESCATFNDTKICYKKVMAEDELLRLFGTKTTYNVGKTLFQTTYNPRNETPQIDSSCRPISLYLISRHAIRYPDADEIILFRDKLPDLRSKIVKKYEDGGGSLCDSTIQGLRDWNLKMKPEFDNLVTESGIEETKEIARRFLHLYPNLLDPKKSKIDIAITERIRTNQTANAFLDAILENVSEEASNNNIKFTVRKDLLEFHKTCKKLRSESSGGKDEDDPESYQNFLKGKLIKSLISNFNQRLGFGQKDLSYSSLKKLVLKVCSFEFAINGTSPWCPLLPNSISAIMDYESDLDDELGSVHGRPWGKGASCKLLGDVLEKFQDLVKGKSSEGSLVQTYLRFTHAGALKPLFGNLGLFNDLDSNPNFPDQGFCSSLDRKWRTSLAVPFGSNIGFVLWACPKEVFKVVTYVQETPVLVGKCKELACDAKDFFGSYEGSRDNCDLSVICKKSNSNGGGGSIREINMSILVSVIIGVFNIIQGHWSLGNF